MSLQEYRAEQVRRWAYENEARIRAEFWARKAAQAVESPTVAPLRLVR